MVVTCDRLGRIYVTRDVAYLDDADRNTRTTTYNLTTDDVIEITMPRIHNRTVKSVRGEGVNAETAVSNIVGFFSDGIAAPSSGTATESLSRQVLDQSLPQEDLNKRTGHHY